MITSLLFIKEWVKMFACSGNKNAKVFVIGEVAASEAASTYHDKATRPAKTDYFSSCGGEFMYEESNGLFLHNMWRGQIRIPQRSSRLSLV